MKVSLLPATLLSFLQGSLRRRWKLSSVIRIPSRGIVVICILHEILPMTGY
ncbi:hypothetical protein AT6N2_C2616 [Agrobacterium tumefaciens]|nr:hypothetical protein AT6N2_C2616 [Agrobacterium tumefaciens]